MHLQPVDVEGDEHLAVHARLLIEPDLLEDFDGALVPAVELERHLLDGPSVLDVVEFVLRGREGGEEGRREGRMGGREGGWLGGRVWQRARTGAICARVCVRARVQCMRVDASVRARPQRPRAVPRRWR